MPTRTLNKTAVFDVETLYTNFLSSQSGWSGGSADDIESMIWDNTALSRGLIVTKRKEITAPNSLKRQIKFTENEVYNALLSGLAFWGGGGAASILTAEHDLAGRKLLITKTSEPA